MNTRSQLWFEAATLALILVLSVASQVFKPQDASKRVAVLDSQAHEVQSTKN